MNKQFKILLLLWFLYALFGLLVTVCARSDDSVDSAILLPCDPNLANREIQDARFPSKRNPYE